MKQEEITEGKILMRRFTHDHFNPGEHSSDWLFNLEKEDAGKALFFYYTEVAPNLSYKDVMEFLVKLEAFEYDELYFSTTVGHGPRCHIYARRNGVEKAVAYFMSSHRDLTCIHNVWHPDTKLEAIFITIVKFIKWFNETYNPNT
jgi:hypothetical protein